MFYIFSKVFWVLAQPLSIVFLFGLCGIALAMWGRRRLGIVAASLGLLVLGLVTFTNLGAVLIAPLEARFERPAEMPADVGAILVLGGSTAARVSTARGIAELNAAGDRFTDAVRLARLYPEAKIVFTGGAGILDRGTESEAVTAERFFLSMGIEPERLVLESLSRNTDENADFSAELLADVDGSIMLVTSAFHMPRSVGLFRRVRVDVVPWPTDYRGPGNDSFGIDLANLVFNVEVASIAIKEWIGLAAYYWTGRIDSMLPDQASN